MIWFLEGGGFDPILKGKTWFGEAKDRELGMKNFSSACLYALKFGIWRIDSWEVKKKKKIESEFRPPFLETKWPMEF